MTKKYCYECGKEQEITYDNYVDIEEDDEGKIKKIEVNVYIHCGHCSYYIDQEKINIEKSETWIVR